MTIYTLITGASSGIGKELAKICAKNGENLVLVARRKEKLQELKNEIETSTSAKVKIIALDLSKDKAAEQLYEKTKDLDIENLINNAGFGDYGPFLEADWETEAEMIDLNIKTLTQLSKLYAKDMVKKKHGRIMNVASTAAFQPGPLMSVYYATKAYVLLFSEGISEELKGTGVTITALCPGATASEFEKNAHLKDSKLFKGNLASAKEVAEYGYRAMISGKVVAVHGLKNKLNIFLERFTPRFIVRRVVKRLQEKSDNE